MYSIDRYHPEAAQVVDRRELLKIKLKSLAAEAKFIRKEEKKVGTLKWVEVPARERLAQGVDIVPGPQTDQRHIRPAYWKRCRMSVNPLADEMYQHRTRHLREESRLTGLAYGMVRDISFERIEGDCKKPLKDAQWLRIYAMVEKYGNDRQRRAAVAAIKLLKRVEPMTASGEPVNAMQLG